MKIYLITVLLLLAATTIPTFFTKEKSVDKRLVGNVLHSLPQASLRQQVKTIYDSEIGVREATGHNDGTQVEQYLRYTGLGKGNAWCAAFVCWVLGKAGVENPKTAWAASLFPNDKLIWKQGKPLTTGNTQRATIFGIYFPSLKRIAHCGFIDHWGEKEVITVEGNTNDSGSSDGDGVYRKRRPIKSLYAVTDWIGKEGGR